MTGGWLGDRPSSLARIARGNLLAAVSSAQEGAKAAQLGTDVVVAQSSEFGGQVCGNEATKVLGVRH